MTDRDSEHLNEDVGTDAVPDEGTTGPGGPTLASPGVALTGQPALDIGLGGEPEDGGDDGANPV